MQLASFKNTAKGLQAIVLSLPVVSTAVAHHTPFPFPPIGENEAVDRVGAVIVAGCALFLPYIFLPRIKNVRTRAGAIAAAFVLLLISFFVYKQFEDKYVIAIEYASAPTAFVTRGTDRNPSLAPSYLAMTENQLIHAAGQTESALELVYSRDSLLANRAKLFWSYAAFLSILEVLLGSYVAWDSK